MPTPALRPLRATIGVAGATLLLAASALLTGCGGTTTAQPEEPAATVEPAPVAEETMEAEPSTDAGAVSDICSLVTPEELAAILPGAVVAQTLTLGSLTADFGGQCVWTDDPSGAVSPGQTTQLELVVWQADGINPAPPEAVPAGSGEIVPSDSGAYFAGPNQSLWIRLTGVQATDAAKVAATQALAPAVRSRL